jgi:hypothetical protein
LNSDATSGQGFVVRRLDEAQTVGEVNQVRSVPGSELASKLAQPIVHSVGGATYAGRYLLGAESLGVQQENLTIERTQPDRLVGVSRGAEGTVTEAKRRLAGTNEQIVRQDGRDNRTDRISGAQIMPPTAGG